MSPPGPDSTEPSRTDRPDQSDTAKPYRVRRAMAADRQYSRADDAVPTAQAQQVQQAPVQQTQAQQAQQPAVPGPPPPPAQPPTVQAAAPGKRRTPIVVAVAAALVLVLVLAIVGGIAYAVSRDDSASTNASGARDGNTGTPTPTATPTSGPSTTAALTPAAQLSALADKGSATAKSHLNGKWVPQTSAKQKGLVAGGKTWSEQDILDEYNQTQRSYGNALLVRSGDFSTFKRAGFYVTIINRPSSSPNDALGWCKYHGLGADDCFAKLISTTHGVQGGTKMQK